MPKCDDCGRFCLASPCHRCRYGSGICALCGGPRTEAATICIGCSRGVRTTDPAFQRLEQRLESEPWHRARLDALGERAAAGLPLFEERRQERASREHAAIDHRHRRDHR